MSTIHDSRFQAGGKKPSNEEKRLTVIQFAKALFAVVTSRINPLFTVALITGLRKWELLGLKWSDLDLSRKLIRVMNPKSGRTRFIPMSEGVVTALKALQTAKNRPYVFADPNSSKATRNIERAWREALREAKIRNFSFHDLRHTFASRLAFKGAKKHRNGRMG
jgi:integrase